MKCIVQLINVSQMKQNVMNVQKIIISKIINVMIVVD